MEKITKFIKENKSLREIKKSTQIDLKRSNTLLKNAQKDVENVKENYKVLRLKSKNLFGKIQNVNKSAKNNGLEHSEAVPRKKRKLVKENNNALSSGSIFAIEGLLVIWGLIKRHLYLQFYYSGVSRFDTFAIVL